MKIKVILRTDEGTNKIWLIKGFRTTLGCSLKDAKGLVERTCCKQLLANDDIYGLLAYRVIPGREIVFYLTAEQYCRYHILTHSPEFILWDPEIVSDDLPVYDLTAL